MIEYSPNWEGYLFVILWFETRFRLHKQLRCCLVSPFVCFVCSFGFLVARSGFWFEDWISGQPVLERRHSKKQLPMVWDGPLLMNQITRKKVISPLRRQINRFLFFKREWFSSVVNWAIRGRHHPSINSPFRIGSVGCRSFKQARNIKKK